ncbi:hypothetical protein Clacol_006488 [Clathrus columnatus]|uniref:Cupredoxin n=1 Tax=Clathrus columnatus TaxID=1419009 RepID=A0AAV5AES8_9AGAM|nr:hypothetical protein Clacol_006488 [Clathrus columnatus]
MRFFTLLQLALAATGFVRAQVNHTVIVGGPGGVVAYTPNQINATVGDIVTFIFQQKNHTVTQSSFNDPCTPIEGGFDSGFQPVAEDNLSGPFPAASITVASETPVWIFCRQTHHCSMGMVFAINPNGKFDAFLAAAEATGNSASTTWSSSSLASSSSTPTITSTSTSPSPTVPSSSSPTTHLILVGNDGALSYSPSNITAQVGDTITFQFMAKNHTVTQSSFNDPCRKIEATSGTPGFDSGFMPVPAGSVNFPTFSITVNDTNPTWAYCRQDNPSSHCGQGMVFAINANESSSKSFEAFKALAEELNGTSSSTSPAKSNAAPNAYATCGLLINFLTVYIGLSLLF